MTFTITRASMSMLCNCCTLLCVCRCVEGDALSLSDPHPTGSGEAACHRTAPDGRPLPHHGTRHEVLGHDDLGGSDAV